MQITGVEKKPAHVVILILAQTNLILQVSFQQQQKTWQNYKVRQLQLQTEIHNEFSDFFSDLGCFEGTFSLQIKDDSHMYQPLFFCTVKATEKELEPATASNYCSIRCWQMSEWSNSFVLVPKANWKVRLCLDWVWLNKTLNRPIQQGPNTKWHTSKANRS